MLRILNAIVGFVFSFLLSLGALIMLVILPPLGLLMLFGLHRYLLYRGRPATTRPPFGD